MRGTMNFHKNFLDIGKVKMAARAKEMENKWRNEITGSLM